MLKSKVKQLLQNILGFDNFLFYFSIITIKRLYMNKHEAEICAFFGAFYQPMMYYLILVPILAL